METAHQQHAAHCRHAKAIEAKRIYCQELSASFATYRPTLPLKSRINAYASSRRSAVCKYVSRFGFKESTLRTWLREWKTLIYAGF